MPLQIDLEDIAERLDYLEDFLSNHTTVEQDIQNAWNKFESSVEGAEAMADDLEGALGDNLEYYMDEEDEEDEEGLR